MSAPNPVSESSSLAADAHRQWFVEEVHRHDASLKNYVRRSFPGVRDIDDLVQESYLRIWKRQLQRPITEVGNSVKASVKGFLFQVTRHLALDWLRHERSGPFISVTDFASSNVIEERADPCESVCTNQEFELLFEAIYHLPARCREVLVLRKIQGRSVAETASKLGLSEETVHGQTRRGLQRVQEFLLKKGAIQDRQP